MRSKESRAIRYRPARSIWQVLVAGTLALVVAMGIGRFAYTPILPTMQSTFDLSNPAVASLASSNYLGYLVGAVLVAFVPASRFQGALLRASLWTVAVATVLVGLTVDFWAWFVLRFIAGLAGAGILVLASVVVLEELSRRGQLGLSGIFYSGPGLGIAISGAVVLALGGLLEGAPATWRAGWLILGALALVFVFPCVGWLPEGKTDPQNTGLAGVAITPEEDPAGSAARAKGAIFALVLLGLAYFLEGFGYIVTGTFLPVIIESLPGLGGLGTSAWILAGLAAALSTLLWASAASRLSVATALGAAYVVQAIGILLPAVSDAWWAAAVSALFFGGTFVGIAALTLTYAREVTRARTTGLAIGLLTAVYGAGQVLGPLVAARLADDADGFRPALFAASAAVALGGLLMPVVRLVGAGNTEYGKERIHDNAH